MTLDELAAALLPGAHGLDTDAFGVVSGRGVTQAGIEAGVVGIAGGMPVGIDAAIVLASHVLAHVSARGDRPLLVLVDTQSQAMTRRDELLGLPEFLGHLTKSLLLASLEGHRTIGIMYGAAAAGAFISTAMATDILVTVPGAAPSVMDLPSIARVTKLPLQKLEEMSRTTPIFAPGVAHLARMGAVHEDWDDDAGSYAARLDALLGGPAEAEDRRDALGLARDGRTRAAPVARRVRDEARPGR